MSGRCLWVLLAALLLTMMARPQRAEAAGPLDLHVLAIGSEHYANSPNAEYSRFGDLTGIADGARDVAEALRAAGARRVRLLTSSDDRLVSRLDILRTLDEAIAGAKSSKSPFLMVYFAGHGVSDGFAWSHFSVPGPMVYRGELETLARADGLERHALFAGEIVDRLDQAKIPYMLILDNCREGRDRSVAGTRQILGDAGEDLLGTAQAALRKLNLFEGPNPVLYSTPPGTSVPTAAHPGDEFMSMGPLGRRILLAFRHRAAGSTMSLGAFVAALTDAKLDTETAPAVTQASADTSWRSILLRFGRKGPAILQRAATGSQPDPCCEPTSGPAATKLSGSIRILSAPDAHWLLQGEPRSLASPGAAISGYAPQPGAITIEATQGENRWNLTLAAREGGTLAAGLYENAERALVQSSDKPGISFSTRGRSCNAVAGRYRIDQFAAQGSRVGRLAAVGWVRCDDIPGSVQIEVNVKAAD